MSELRRLSEDSSLPGFDRAALRSAALDRPSPAARLAAQAALGIGAGSAIVSTAPGAAATTTKLAGWTAFTKIAVVALVVGGGAIGAPRFLRSVTLVAPPQPATHASADRRAVAPAPPQIASTPEEKGVAVESLPEAPADPSARARAPAPNRPSASTVQGGERFSRLGDEIARLEAARARLSAGDSVAAHFELDAYGREFGGGTLAPEAAALRADAFIAAGDRDRAVVAARRYLADHPNGAAAPRMRGIASTDVAPFRDQNAESTP